jgi:hypothetical protein
MQTDSMGELKGQYFTPYAGSVLAGALILCYWAFYNNYPLVYSDTGSFIAAGAEKGWNSTRVFYGLFIRHISLHETLFLVVFAQGLIISSMIHFVFSRFSSSSYKIALAQITIIILTLFTGISFHVSQIMADIFTSVSILCLVCLLFIRDLNRSELILLALLFVFSNITHNTHSFIAIFTLSITGILFFLVRKRIIFNWKRYCLVFALSIASWLILSTSNLIYHKKFEYSENSFMYRMSGLIEMGILQLYLEEHCNAKTYSLCNYIKDKPGIFYNFLWDDNSPANQNGGWQAHREEYSRLMNDLFREPKYVKLFTIKSLEASAEQLFCFNSGETNSYLNGSAPYGAIDWHFHNDMRKYINSKQNLKLLHFDTLNYFQLIFVFLSFCLLIICNLTNFLSPDLLQFRLIIYCLLIAIWVNAYLCSTFSMVGDRFQSRVVWLIPFFAIVIISNNIKFPSRIRSA